jgi:hypothetical protein
LSTCATLAAQNDWVSSGSDAGSKECVVSVKALTALSGVSTLLWRRGKKVKGGNILPGTAIATFPIKSNGEFRFKGHGAIFVSEEASGIWVYDQWAPKPSNPEGKRFGKRLIRYKCSGHVSDDGEAFFVIELHEFPSSEPALCSSSSTY